MKLRINLPGQKTGLSFTKRILVIMVATGCIITSAFAGGEESKDKAVNNLKKQFSNAKDIQWKVTADYTKATFSWNNQAIQVFYNNDGETIAESRLINLNELPLRAQQYLANEYADYQVKEAIEFNSEEAGHCYYVSLAKDASKQILRISSEGDASVFRP